MTMHKDDLLHDKNLFLHRRAIRLQDNSDMVSHVLAKSSGNY